MKINIIERYIIISTKLIENFEHEQTVICQSLGTIYYRVVIFS